MMEVLHRPLPLHRFIEVSAAHLGANLAESAQLQENREQIMVNVFENEIDRILEERPELKDKPELNTLITMGAYHTRLRHTLAANSVESRREFATDMPMVYGYQNVTQREYAYGRQPSEELLEQAWVENALSGTLASKLDDYEDLSVDELVAYYRTVIPSFSHEQRRDLHAIFYEHGHDAGKASAELDAYLQENGFGALPQNASEVRTAPQEQDKRRHLGKKALSN